MRGHTGSTMTLGQGSPVSLSTKQNLNTQSSTESKLVGADYTMPPVLRTHSFLEEQEFAENYNIMFQDNMSTMMFENNVKRSSTKMTKHISI